jgi:hypothetical protein
VNRHRVRRVRVGEHVEVAELGHCMTAFEPGRMGYIYYGA